MAGIDPNVKEGGPRALTVTEKTVQLGSEVWRMRWPLIIFGLVAISREWGILPRTSPTVVWLSGLAKMFLGAIAAHILVQQGFPYMDMRGLLFRALGLFEFAGQLTTEDRTLACYSFVGCCILRGLIYAAAMIAVSQALG
jgi:hypothetical protein